MKRWITTNLLPLSKPVLVIALTVSISMAGSFYMYRYLSQPLGRRRLALLALMVIVLLVVFYGLIQTLFMPALGKLRKSQLTLALLGSLLSGLYLFTFSPWEPPVLYFSSNHLEIIASGDKNPSSDGTIVELLGFSAEGEFLSLSSFLVAGDWQRIGDHMVADGTQPATLSWQGIARDIVLIFRTSPQSGIVRVRYDGKEQSYDLYSPEPDQLFIHEQSPKNLPGTRLPAIILTVIPLTFLILIGLCILLLAWPGSATNSLIQENSLILDRRLPFIFSLLGMILFFVVSRKFGLWIVGDSVNYTSAARHLIAGEGYIALNGDTFDWWPPLYPTLLAIAELFPLSSPLVGVRWMHAILLGAIIYCAGLLMQHLMGNTTSKKYLAAVLLLIAIGYPLTESAVSLLSEPLFIFLELLFFLWFVRFLETGRIQYALLFTLAVALHALTRYPGVALIFSGCLALLLFPFDAFWKRLKRSFLFGLFSSMPLALWLARNYILTGLFSGVRTPAQLTLMDNLRLAATTISNWFFPPDWNPTAILILLFLLAASLIAIIIKNKQSTLRSFTHPLFLLLTIFTVVYAIYLILTLSVYHNAQLGNRLLSPIFVPLWLILAYLLLQIRIVLLPPFRSNRWGNWLALVLFLGWLPAPITAQVALAQRPVLTYSTGFSMWSLQDSETLAYLRQHPLPGETMIYSNCHRCLYMFANIQPALPFDSKVRDMYLTPDNLPFYIVWFNNVLPEGGMVGVIYPMPDPAELLGMPVKIKEYASFLDGKIYLVSP